MDRLKNPGEGSCWITTRYACYSFHPWPFSRVCWSYRQTRIVESRPDRQHGVPIHVESQVRYNLVGGHHLKYNPTHIHLSFWVDRVYHPIFAGQTQ